MTKLVVDVSNKPNGTIICVGWMLLICLFIYISLGTMLRGINEKEKVKKKSVRERMLSREGIRKAKEVVRILAQGNQLARRGLKVD